MAKTMGQKLKLLYLRDYLLKNSDEGHPVTVADMAGYLEAQGISAERKSLYDDIESLISYGMDIITVQKGRANGYYVGERDFQLPELKLLVDAVQSSRFITADKTLSLIKRLEDLTSLYEGRYLQRQVYVQNRVKTMNESVYYNVDAISEAIEKKRAIAFKYFDYGPDKERHFRRDGGEYQASPGFLVWEDENYYMVAVASGEGRPRHYRVDKMSGIRLLDRAAEDVGVEPTVYSNTLFGMYAGERQKVTIRFKNQMAGIAIDRFGKDHIFAPDGEGRFTVSVDVSVSPQFFAWVAALGDGAEIVSPDSVRQQMRDFLQSSLSVYQ